MGLLAVLVLVVSSCNPDPEIANSLAGTWEGKMYVKSSYNGYTYDATYSRLYFDRDPYSFSSGTGYWVDYYDRPAPFSYIANHTRWTVSNGVISILLLEEGTRIQIRDYHLSDGYFMGTIYYNDVSVDFRLRHTYAPYPNDLRYGFDVYYNAKKNSYTTRGTMEDGGVENPYRIIKR